MSAMESDRANPLHEAAHQPVFQSRLRAKREERLQQRQHMEQHHSDDEAPAHSPEVDGLHSRLRPMTSSLEVVDHGRHAVVYTSRITARSTGEETRRRQRGEARRILIEYQGTPWDAVQSNSLSMLQNFFQVEGATKLVEAHAKADTEFGRTLLHTAASWGHLDVIALLLVNGARVDAIDTVATRLTPLMEAARSGHASVCVLLIERGADPTLRDASGDNAFHFAARFHHGECLLRMSMALDHQALEEVWTATNVRRQTPVDYIRSHTTIFPMITRRLGDRVPLQRREPRASRFSTTSITPATTQTLTAAGDSLVYYEHDGLVAGSDASTPSLGPRTMSSAGHLAGLSSMDTLGLDVSSFAYQSKDGDSIATH